MWSYRICQQTEKCGSWGNLSHHLRSVGGQWPAKVDRPVIGGQSSRCLEWPQEGETRDWLLHKDLGGKFCGEGWNSINPLRATHFQNTFRSVPQTGCLCEYNYSFWKVWTGKFADFIFLWLIILAIKQWTQENWAHILTFYSKTNSYLLSK